jgi:hypothetical protein
LVKALLQRMRLQSWHRSGCAAAILACASAAAAGPPAAGRYVAQMCVAVSNVEPACGRAEIEWRAADRAVLRISDVVYALRLYTSQLDVVLMHGAMQIDGFTAIYEWDGPTLRFIDADKNVRYEVRSERPLMVLPKRPAAPASSPGH